MVRAVLAAAVLAFLLLIREILGIAGLGLALAAAVAPALRWLDRHAIPRWVGAVSVLLLVLALLGFTLAALIPPVVSELRQLETNLPHLLGQLRVLLIALHIPVPDALTADIAAPFGTALAGLAHPILTGFGVIGRSVGTVAVILVIASYFALTREGLTVIFSPFLPDRALPFFGRLERRIEERLGRWLRGQLTISLLTAAVSFVVFSLLHVPYALLLALLGGVTMFIPVASFFLSGIPTVLVAGTVGTGAAVATGVFLVLMHQAIANALVPRLMGSAVQLDPIVVLVVMLSGAGLGGVVGLLLAVPVAAAVSVAIEQVRDR